MFPFSKIIAKIATSENSTSDFVHFFRQLRPSHWKFKRVFFFFPEEGGMYVWHYTIRNCKASLT